MRRTEAPSYEKYFKKLVMIDLNAENAEWFAIPFSVVEVSSGTLNRRSRAKHQCRAWHLLRFSVIYGSLNLAIGILLCVTAHRRAIRTARTVQTKVSP
jgi:hypothetical protein